MSADYLYNIENMTPAQIKIAYEREIINAQTELINIINFLNSSYDIPEEKRLEMQDRQLECEMRIHDLTVEYNLAKI